MKRAVQVALVLLLLPMILIACGGGENEKDSSASSAEDAPTIKIVSPEEGASLSGEAIEIKMEITNFIQDGGAIGNAMVPGRGHWHLRLDDGIAVIDVGNEVTLEDVPSGPHTVAIFLVNNDHTPLEPRVEDILTVNVR